MSVTLFKNALAVNEGVVIETDVRIVGQRIDRIAKEIEAHPDDSIVDAKGRFLIPGND